MLIYDTGAVGLAVLSPDRPLSAGQTSRLTEICGISVEVIWDVRLRDCVRPWADASEALSLDHERRRSGDLASRWRAQRADRQGRSG